MKISIIIPVYNAEKTIERLIKTIQSQTYKNYELILINDGSTDKTKEILEKYKSDNVNNNISIRYIRIIKWLGYIKFFK